MIAREGENGVFSQSWYPVCRSIEIAPGKVIGQSFLGGKIAIYRGVDQRARVVSGYCVHMGADLSIGAVVGNHLRCAFHHFEYGEGGYCVKTGVGAPPPKAARIFEFPTMERYGLIWAFNGEAALWSLPDLDQPEANLVLVERDVAISSCDPYMLTANAFDWQHFAILHDFHSASPLREEDIRWNQYSCGFDFSGTHWQGESMRYTIEVYGTNIYLQQGTLNGRWYAMVIPAGLPGPGVSRTFLQILVPRGDGSAEAERQARHTAEALADMEMRFVLQDQDVLNSIHFGPGHLLPEDRQFARFLKYLRNYPRANPAKHYLE
ncbi:MAG: Rieske 2Fe-2S domain-containing protein [Steroidobacteraceae bacterium]|jgi:phenylpropionate dioxygenase-like ring-hydroxylating dioxygenase large terminal subunit